MPSQHSEHMSDHTSGHRERMKQKCDAKGMASLTDQELFEILLYPLLPRIDTKPIVKDCFKNFSNFSAIINAPDAKLSEIKGVGKETIRHLSIIAELLDRISYERVIHKNFLTNWTELQSFCLQKLSYRPIEALMAILLNNQNQVIAIKDLESGTVNQMTVYPREILKVALLDEAVGMILVHNHPSGDERASKQDIDLTKSLQKTLKSANIKLYDHLIVAGGKCISMRNQGLFDF